MENTHTMSATAQAIYNALINRKGQLGLTIVTATEPSMLGGKKNPFLGRVTKVTTWKNARCGVSYTASIEGKMERKGMENAEYIAGKSTTDYLNDILQLSKDGTKEYLKIGRNSATSSASVVTVDGIVVYATTENGVQVYDAKIYEALKPYIKPATISKRQQEQGLTADEVIGWVTPNVENVVMIAQGRVADGTYNKLYENPKYNHIRPLAA